MTSDDDQLPDDAELCPRELLEEWTVPEMPKDMKERVMAKIYDPTHEQWNVGVPTHAYGAPPPRSATAVVAITTAAAALVASAAAVLMTVSSHFDAPRIDEPPTVAPAPIVVAADPGRIARGHLTIAVTPVDAEVELDGVALPGPSPFIATGLSVGPHELRVHREGHLEWKRVVEVPASQLHLPIALSPESIAAPAIADFLPRSVEAVPPGTPVPAPEKAMSEDPLGSAPKPGVRQASATVKGAMDKDIIRRIVRAHINEIRLCFNQGLAKDPTLEGRVTIQFTIGPDGTVPVAVVQDSNLTDPKVAQCMAKAVKRWKFPKPDGGGNVVVTYPFVLTAD